MKISKKITFSEVGSGYLHIANITTNNPTTISASFGLVSPFSSPGDNPYVTGNFKFHPVTGNDRLQTFNVAPSTSTDFLQEITGISSFFTQVNGELLLELHRSGGDSPAPTTGELVLIIDVDSIALS
jgi:hypothetical protein